MSINMTIDASTQNSDLLSEDSLRHMSRHVKQQIPIDENDDEGIK